MKTTTKYFSGLVLTFVFIVGTLTVSAQIPDEIILGVKAGNAKTLAKYFNNNIELAVPGNDDVYSKSQAEQLLHSFFQRNKPQSFKLIHKGGKEGARYLIGNLKCGPKVFRVYMLLKTLDGKVYIHQLRIEKEGRPNP